MKKLTDRLSHRLSRLVPPWTTWVSQASACGVALLLMMGLAAGSFLNELAYATRAFYSPTTGALLDVAPGTQVDDFIHMLRATDTYVPFLLMPVIAILLAFYNYSGFRQSNKALYLMRRLPDRWALTRYCIGVPVLALAVTALAMVLLTLVCLAEYYYLVPDQCIPPNQWDKFWTGLPYVLFPFLESPTLIGGI